ncbi:DUF3558 domain-containing protein [Haloechinothrix alba]|uniref:DUF3558 domain-containing protein n=1 Tax=Haloechinothrix alba TaxID=664784 RepID=UPI0015950ADB|nr:DUF3558 domain-containing protein [Haloechinothrix alba]
MTTGVVAVLLLVTGCSDSTSGTADPAGQGDAGNEQEHEIGLPHSGAPAVEEPVVDTREYEADPCTILPDDKLDDAGFAIDKSSAESDMDRLEGPMCTWRFEKAGHGVLGASLGTDDGEGLSHIYRLEANSDLEYFTKQDPIDGYPAVVAGKRDNRTDRGECDVYVGIRDETALYIPLSASRDNPLKEAPCEAVYELATIAVDTITGGA